MKYIFEYEFNDKKYVAYMLNNEIRFGIQNDNRIVNRLNSVEIFFIKSIYKFIVGNKYDFFELSPIMINDKKIRILYNEKNKLYSFYREINDRLIIPDINLLNELNYTFNNQEMIFYKNSNDNDKSKNKYKVFAKIGGIIVSVFVFSSVVLSSLALSDLPVVIDNQDIFNVNYYASSVYKNLEKKENNKDFSYEEIEDIIKKNVDLGEKEKNFLINGLKDEIEENVDYIDMDDLKTKLSHLKIIYYPSYYYNELGEKIYNIYGIKGAYSTIGEFKDCIELFGDDQYITNDFSDCSKDVFVHEVNHMLTKNSFLLSVPGKIGYKVEEYLFEFDLAVDPLLEIINELFSREYYPSFNINQEDVGYDELMPIGYALCEILDENLLRKYKFNSDNFYITKYLDSIGVDKYYAYDLYKSLVLTEKSVYGFANREINNEINKNNQNIYSILKYCYEQKYNRPMEHDLIMMSYFYNSIYVDEAFNESYRKVLGVETIDKIVPKGYFSSSYKKQNPVVKVEVNGGEIINITNENRYLPELKENIVLK